MASIRKTMAEINANPPQLTADEAARLDAMTQDEIDRNAETDGDYGLASDEALERAGFARDVRQARVALSLTQAAFAERFHIALSRLRDWERGRYRPDSVAAAYIKTIRHDAKAVARALASAD